jgi:hypothetical protein
VVAIPSKCSCFMQGDEFPLTRILGNSESMKT